MLGKLHGIGLGEQTIEWVHESIASYCRARPACGFSLVSILTIQSQFSKSLPAAKG